MDPPQGAIFEGAIFDGPPAVRADLGQGALRANFVTRCPALSAGADLPRALLTAAGWKGERDGKA
ncbi:hypothetical protein DWV16_06080 [Anaerotruncus sp. AF02-27]|nr:hypothetical protein DWV16_06080 [Anaerotruncus sp. AF02-27]